MPHLSFLKYDRMGYRKKVPGEPCPNRIFTKPSVIRYRDWDRTEIYSLNEAVKNNYKMYTFKYVSIT